MEVYNQEGHSYIMPAKKRKVVLIFNRQEATDLIEAIEEAVKARPRKKKWKKMLDQLESEVCIF